MSFLVRFHIVGTLIGLATPLICAAGQPSPTATRTSVSYSILEDVIDSGGASLVSSPGYLTSGNAAGQQIVAAAQTSAAYKLKAGYVAQLFDVRSLSITSSPSNVNERATTQLSAAPLLDDTTALAALDPSTVSWNIISGPIVSISTSGVATAATVYLDSGASIGGTLGSLSGTGILTVVNVTADDYGSYANDGIDDAWQVQYFGQPPNANAGPNVDFDGTGQTNYFKYIAGLNPLDPTSRFTLKVARVSSQPNQTNLTFSPRLSDRTYSITGKSNLLPATAWTAINASAPSDNGNERTITDLSASSPKFYRVEIVKP